MSGHQNRKFKREIVPQQKTKNQKYKPREDLGILLPTISYFFPS